MTGTTYRTLADALADPSSSLSRFVRESASQQAENAAVIDARVAQGATREQAWLEQIAVMRSTRQQRNP